MLVDVIGGNAAWFEALDDQGKPQEWLASTDARIRDAALSIIRRVAEKSGNRVARLLRPYSGRDKEWSWRVVWSLPLDPGEDSDDLFELRLQLIHEGSYLGEHVDWAKLVQSNPARFFLLASHLITIVASRLSQDDEESPRGRRSRIDWYGLDTAIIPHEDCDTLFLGWEQLSLSVGFASIAGRRDFEGASTLETYAVDFENLKAVIGLLKKVGRELLRKDWRSFVDLGEDLVKRNPQVQSLFLYSLGTGPSTPELADWVLEWLCGEPWRVRLRFQHHDNPWQISGEVVERFAPICSDNSYRALEEYLLNYREPDFGPRLQDRDELLKEHPRYLSYPSFAGGTQYHLLPKLPSARRSECVRLRLLECQRKFKDMDDVFFAGVGGEGGMVGSPISMDEVRNRLSDQAWLRITSVRLEVE